MSDDLHFEKVRGLLQQREASEKSRDQIPPPVLPDFPPVPGSCEQTGLSFNFLSDLTLKTLLVRGQITGGELSDCLRLPYATVLEVILRFLKDDGQVEIKRGTDYQETSWELALTQKGTAAANMVMQREGYIGPAPIPLAQYNEQVENQPVRWESVTEDMLRRNVEDLVVNPFTLAKLGPAFNSGQSMLLYGHAGNGKTLMSERLSRSLRGGLLIPFAVEVGGQVVRVYDAVYHHIITDPQEQRVALAKKADARGGGRVDERWLLCSRPFIVTGGEVTLEHLEMTFEPKLRFYIAPLQMKANGGILMIDDFGRQRVSPKELLNRWIVPLEKRYDYHNLITGQQIRVPFQVFIIFSTNLAPRDLVEEAFLRRIRYKIEIPDPSEEEFREIFRRCCISRGIPFDSHMLDYLIEKHYVQAKRGFRSVHPRDLLSQLIDIANYRNEERKLTKELLDTAVATYFVDLG